MEYFGCVIYKKERWIVGWWEDNERCERICEMSGGLGEEREGKVEIEGGRYCCGCNSGRGGEVYKKRGYNEIGGG